MSSIATRTEVGRVTGTGALITVETRQGDTPIAVRLFNEDGLATAEWTESMGDGAAVKRITDGTMTVLTTTGITPVAGGFTIGADADLNVAGEVIHWVAQS